jgi:imidazolonepropionase-like amidohydrolase
MRAIIPRTPYAVSTIAAPLVCVITLSSGAAQDALPAQIIENVRIFDGVRVLPERTVLIRDGRIAEIGTSTASSSGVVAIDGTGQTLLPGLIDSHVHVHRPIALMRALVFGVTTVFEMFGAELELVRQLKKEQADGTPNRAELLSAAICVTAPGGHGTQYGIKIPTIAAPEEAQAFVDARIAEGSDYIKIIYGPSRVAPEVITRETLAAVIRAAHARDKLTVVHVSEQERAREAVELGADGLAHIFNDAPPEAGFADFVAAHKAFVVPTLTIQEGPTESSTGLPLVLDKRLMSFLAPADIDHLRGAVRSPPPPPRSYTHSEAAVRALSAAGVPILAGTDAPNAGRLHGFSLHRELELLVRAGLTPIAALAAATSEPAKQFRLADRGRIAPGLRADLLLVRGDPTSDISATRDIVAVWKGGIAFDRQTYRAALAPAEKRD